MREEKVSVAMATYNGEKYIAKQIETILKNLENNDELIISDDGSTDATLSIINDFKDNRIKLLKGPKIGLKKNFENAIRFCTGDYIFLSDQDDEWFDNKVEKIVEVFKSNNYILVQHDALVIDQNKDVIFDSFAKHRNVKTGIINNLIRNSYHGCLIAFKKELKDKILPIPQNIYLHDQWIGMIAELEGKTCFIEDKLMIYRRHLNNNSSFKHLPVIQMVKNRIQYFLALVNFLIFKRG